MAGLYGDRWRRGKRLGGGGQADVYWAEDATEAVGERCVLKCLRNHRQLKRFEREIEAALRLSHENIVRVFDYDLAGQNPYLVAEYCAGKSLRDAEPFWRASPASALDLFRQICEGVAHAHNQRVAHRDLKPGNIFLRAEQGPAVVGDFGLCYLEDLETRVTRTDEAVGARNYTAPELESGRVEDVSVFYKSDVYSLGKILYWLLRGRVFDRERHREPGWDLRGERRWSGRDGTEEFWGNIYMEHVNRLLDLMIVEDPGERIAVTKVLALLPKVSRLIEKEYSPIGPGIQQPCSYCGRGHYVLRADDLLQASSFGLDQRSGGEWRILVCDACGHIQFFRIEQAKERDWWLEQDATSGRAADRTSSEVSVPRYTWFEEPRILASGEQELEPSDFIGWEQCTLLLWVQVPPRGERLRNALNNRYLLAHHTGQKDAMNNFNLFALRYTQHYRTDGDWEVLFTNGDAEGLPNENLRVRDNLDPGWHQLVVTWNHAKPELIFAIDGGRAGTVLSRTYRPFWPARQSEYVAVGSWPPPAPYPDSYCDTSLARVEIYDKYIDLAHPIVLEHLRRKP